ncbi:single-stranded DNA-binding protein [Rhodococcus sp. 05-340-1]|jgi:single-strand DNA-binding protein|uniref:single-stranded DNA-binding protein n=1 Tax=unclassified Rhodococcus (in: high G+C Gram-positive bacteria) TaxID=192944 RepID=UPI000B9A9CB1|nr:MULTISPECIES: single-stranded DNA-binding protein [unclassified Rhodococcus (in: high G+C Gram-positive bacteria)]OZD61395.1 single-stranded DNA-binding protein [Rhodococcus sp. 05-340-2]OZD82613.1 single-stranded DNA-binding protein [Rhodococcus sp. 05-340-1]OZF28572.1 single-stranded DNA-binding protein [Rhodococcus sp. 14-2483-1-2]
MYEAQCAVVGTVITNPVKRSTPTGDEVLSFRMASNARRQDRNTGEWTDGGTLYLTVTCWRRLVRGVGASLMKGDPIVAYGQLRTNEYTNRDGVERADLEMRASAVGPDLARCNVSIHRTKTVSSDAPTDGDSEATEPVDGDRDHDRIDDDVRESVPA